MLIPPSQIREFLQCSSPQIPNPKSETFAEGPQIEQIIEVRKFGDLRLAELICGPLTFANYNEDL